MRKDFHPALQTAVQHALAYLQTLDDRPVGSTASVDTLRYGLCKEWNCNPLPAEFVVNELVEDVEGGLNNSVNARFYAWVVGGCLPSALAADWLTSTWDQNAGLYSVSPAAAVVEEAVGSWLKDLFRLPAVLLRTRHWLPDGAHHLSGCGANMVIEATGLGCGTTRAGRLAADSRLLWQPSRDHRPHPPIARLRRPTRSPSCSSTDEPERSIRQHLKRPCASSTASQQSSCSKPGDVNTGSFDDFEALIPMARRYGAWTHVDGAFGMWATASPRFDRLVRGMERGTLVGHRRPQMAECSLRLWLRLRR